MPSRRSLLALFCVTALVGCGDTPHTVLRDVVTSMNELADFAGLIPDNNETAEEVAEAVYKTKMMQLKTKWEGSGSSLQDFSLFDKEKKREADEAVEQLKDESRMALRRVVAQFGGYYARMRPPRSRSST